MCLQSLLQERMHCLLKTTHQAGCLILSLSHTPSSDSPKTYGGSGFQRNTMGSHVTHTSRSQIGPDSREAERKTNKQKEIPELAMLPGDLVILGTMK